MSLPAYDLNRDGFPLQNLSLFLIDIAMFDERALLEFCVYARFYFQQKRNVWPVTAQIVLDQFTTICVWNTSNIFSK